VRGLIRRFARLFLALSSTHRTANQHEVALLFVTHIEYPEFPLIDSTNTVPPRTKGGQERKMANLGGAWS
jgi:hypothetical protein